MAPKLRVCFCPWDEPGSDLLTGQVASGIEVARAWLRLWCGTREPVVSNAAVGLGERPARASKEEPQVAGTARGRVPTRGTGADRLVVATKPCTMSLLKRINTYLVRWAKGNQTIARQLPTSTAVVGARCETRADAVRPLAVGRVA